MSKELQLKKNLTLVIFQREYPFLFFNPCMLICTYNILCCYQLQYDEYLKYVKTFNLNCK